MSLPAGPWERRRCESLDESVDESLGAKRQKPPGMAAVTITMVTFSVSIHPGNPATRKPECPDLTPPVPSRAPAALSIRGRPISARNTRLSPAPSDFDPGIDARVHPRMDCRIGSALARVFDALPRQ